MDRTIRVFLNTLLEALLNSEAGQPLNLFRGSPLLCRATPSATALPTERETKILRLTAGGFSDKEIANSLRVAEGTVKNHVSNILSKLGVRDRTRSAEGVLTCSELAASPAIQRRAACTPR